VVGRGTDIFEFVKFVKFVKFVIQQELGKDPARAFYILGVKDGAAKFGGIGKTFGEAAYQVLDLSEGRFRCGIRDDAFE
jgi:hypothetical protein